MLISVRIFSRATAGLMGELTFVPRLIEPYLHGLLSKEVKELIINSHFKIVTDFDRGSLSVILPGLLGELGCEVISVEKAENRTSPEQSRSY